MLYSPFFNPISGGWITPYQIIAKNWKLAQAEGRRPKYKDFAEERLKGSKDFLILSRNYSLIQEWTRKVRYPEQSLKEDRQIFGIILAGEVDLKYPITTLPLCIANTDSSLRQGPKHLRNYLVDQIKASERHSPQKALWIVDTMAVMRCIKPKNSYKARLRFLIKAVTPSRQWNPIALEFVNDTYEETSSKMCAREERRESEKQSTPR